MRKDSTSTSSRVVRRTRSSKLLPVFLGYIFKEGESHQPGSGPKQGTGAELGDHHDQNNGQHGSHRVLC